MGVSKKVYLSDDTAGAGSVGVVAAAAKARAAQPLLVLLWIGLVAAPWILQVRSFSELAMRHKITQNLIPAERAEPVAVAAQVVARCPVFGLWIAGVWYNIYPSHYFETGDAGNGSVVCHFVTPQYNSHGMFVIAPNKIEPVVSASRDCASDSYPVNFYMYHGSISY